MITSIFLPATAPPLPPPDPLPDVPPDARPATTPSTTAISAMTATSDSENLSRVLAIETVSSQLRPVAAGRGRRGRLSLSPSTEETFSRSATTVAPRYDLVKRLRFLGRWCTVPRHARSIRLRRTFGRQRNVFHGGRPQRLAPAHHEGGRHAGGREPGHRLPRRQRRRQG